MFVSPATVVVVPPNVKVVLPNVIVLFASLACANVPLAILDAFIPVIDDPLPEKELALIKLTPEICDPAPDIVICAFATKVNPLNEVLTDVIFGCAAVVTVPAVSAAPAVATFKLATRVVEVTVNGAVPVAMLEINRVPVIVEFAPTAPSTCKVLLSQEAVACVAEPVGIPRSSILEPLARAPIASVATN
jgi:hypothetical protein